MTREFIQSGQSVPVTVIKIETGRVIDIIEKGYKLSEKVIRFPKVVIGQ